jgi:hypothetical protein
LTIQGGVECWGRNHFGQLGNNSIIETAEPVHVHGLSSGVAAISSGATHTCALKDTGQILCWGGNANGELGVSPAGSDVCFEGQNAQCEKTPVLVDGLTNASAVSAGWKHTCAIIGAGAVKCWGWNNYGQLGNGTATSSSEPVTPIGMTSEATSISAGPFYSCAVVEGEVKCWGSNQNGQLGDGGTSQPYEPVTIPGINNVVAVATGSEHVCALLSVGSVGCWGMNNFGQLGLGYYENTFPFPIHAVGGIPSLSSGATAISAGGFHTCVIMADGTLKCWGHNHDGQLGVATTEECGLPVFPCSTSPINVPGLANVASLSAALDGAHTCVVSANVVSCFGSNFFGESGDSDGDGCSDLDENGLDPTSGGARDPLSYWDFFDVPTGQNLTRDGSVSVSDIFAIVERFNATGDPEIDPLSVPPPAGYHTAYDRGELIGPYPWNVAAADGSIAITDTFSVIAQFGHSCA